VTTLDSVDVEVLKVVVEVDCVVILWVVVV